MAVPPANKFHRPILEIAVETAGPLSAHQLADRVQWSMHNLPMGATTTQFKEQMGRFAAEVIPHFKNQRISPST